MEESKLKMQKLVLESLLALNENDAPEGNEDNTLKKEEIVKKASYLIDIGNRLFDIGNDLTSVFNK